MTKYFAPIGISAELERIMMSIPNFTNRGGGTMMMCRFRYHSHDVDCKYCLHCRRMVCKVPKCPYIAERLEAGVISYPFLLEERFCHVNHAGFHRRLETLAKTQSALRFWNNQHSKLMQEFVERIHQCPNAQVSGWILGAAYLCLTTDRLRELITSHFSPSGEIDWKHVSLAGISEAEYAFCHVARAFSRQKHGITTDELGDEELVDDLTFELIVNALLLSKYGEPVLQLRE